MIVLDASAAVELFGNGSLAEAIARALAEADEPLMVPELFDIEAVSALRRLALAGQIDAHGCEQFLEALADFAAERKPHAGLVERVWELRHNFTAYDAAYIALAEASESTLWTSDAKMVKGHRAKVRLFRVQ